LAIKGLIAIHKGPAPIPQASGPILTLEALALPLQAVRPTGGTTDGGIAHLVEAIATAETAAGLPVAPGEIAASTKAGAGPVAAAAPTSLHASATATATAATTAATAPTAPTTASLEGGQIISCCGI
jgi:hypothetical protein